MPCLQALDFFSKKSNTISKVNYVLIKGVNDSKENALELARLLKKFRFTVKLSKLNECNSLKSSSESKFRLFEKILHKQGIKTCRFYSDGPDIKAGCGQLRKYFLEEIK